MPGMEESIYNLIPPTVEAGSRAPMYRSKFPRGVAPTASTFGTHGTSKPGVKNVGGQIEEYDGPHPAKKGHATFGKTNNRREPTDILRATKPTLPDRARRAPPRAERGARARARGQALTRGPRAPAARAAPPSRSDAVGAATRRRAQAPAPVPRRVRQGRAPDRGG